MLLMHLHGPLETLCSSSCLVKVGGLLWVVWATRFSASGVPRFVPAPMEFFEFQEVSAVNWAHHFGAMYISLEHRYYGDSNPVANYSTANYKYLSSRQVCLWVVNAVCHVPKHASQLRVRNGNDD